jgi:hypothetical protein
MPWQTRATFSSEEKVRIGLLICPLSLPGEKKDESSVGSEKGASTVKLFDWLSGEYFRRQLNSNPSYLQSVQFAQTYIPQSARKYGWVSKTALDEYRRMEGHIDALERKADSLIKYLGGSSGLIALYFSHQAPPHCCNTNFRIALCRSLPVVQSSATRESNDTTSYEESFCLRRCIRNG